MGVAFKYVITEQLPKITYLTIMDYYLLEGFIMLTLLIAENAATGVPTWGSQALRQSLSNYMALVFAVVWGVTHILWMVVLYREGFMRVAWERMSELDEENEGECVCRTAPGIGQRGQYTVVRNRLALGCAVCFLLLMIWYVYALVLRLESCI